MTRLAFDDIPLEISSDGNIYSVALDGRTYQAEIAEAADGRLDLLIDGRRRVAYVSPDGQRRWVTIGGRTFVITRSSAASGPAAAHGASSELTAPMPGQVRAVEIGAGQKVTKGQVLVVLEAMKMEIRLHAPFDGAVSSLEVQVGQTVEREQVLVRLERS